MLSCGLLCLISKASRKARILSFIDLVKCRVQKLSKTKFSIEEGTFPEGRGMSLSRENWFVGLLSIVRVHSQRNVFLLHYIIDLCCMHVLLGALINIVLSYLYGFCRNPDAKPRKQDYYVIKEKVYLC